MNIKRVRMMFEMWLKLQIPKASLDKDKGGDYKDKVVLGIFLGFCAGMELTGTSIDLRAKG